MPLKESRENYYDRVNTYADAIRASKQDVDYLSVTPEPFEVQIPLWEYFERVKRHKADRWQKDFCNRLQSAVENRHLQKYWAIFHAEGQLGKTSILSQAFPAWIFGHLPLFRYALATYNQTRSIEHSAVVLNVMQGAVHKDIFPNKDGWVPEKNVSKESWSTNARRELPDAQHSFNPVGLQTGLTGSGFDWLTIDDPYRESKEAFSEQIRTNLQNFWEYTVVSRTSEHACIVGMFHRYAPEDFAGYLLDKGDFDYVRYASQCDGDYTHKNTGQVFQDPLAREVGEYISPERRPASYYENAKKNKQVWLSMFQGRPTSEEGSFFNTARLLESEEEARLRNECTLFVRAWDNAGTKEAGAYTVGVLMGMRPDKTAVIFDVYRKQVDTAERYEAQKELAKADTAKYGAVIITVPLDVGSAGKDTVFTTKQELKGFIVNARPTSGSKEVRALNVSACVNSGEMTLLRADWNETLKKEYQEFPLSTYKDIVDASADAYNELQRLLVQGTVIQGYTPRHLMSRDEFLAVEKRKPDDKFFRERYNIFIAVKVAPDNSRPTSGVMVARAPYSSNFDHEQLFVFAEYKEFDTNFYKLFEWIDENLKKHVLRRSLENVCVWLHRDSAHLQPTLTEKIGAQVAVFEGDKWVGLSELNWHFKTKKINLLVDRDEMDIPMTHGGLISCRQEIPAWGFTDRGDPTPVGAVLDCLRMCVAEYATFSTPLTEAEKYEKKLQERTSPRFRKDEFDPENNKYYARDISLQMTETFLRKELIADDEWVPTLDDDDDDPSYIDLSEGW